MRKKGFGFAALVVVALVLSRTADAGLTIAATFGSSITSDPNHAAIETTINNAIAVYESAFTNPITVSITFQEMTSGLGQSSTQYQNVGYSTFYNRLAAGARSADDVAAVASLGGPNSLNPVTHSSTINVKTANLKALGYDVVGAGPDGTIGLNTHITDVGSTGTSGQYSLTAVVEHEIDEVLGVGSALPGLFNGDPLPEDLFRYSGAGVRSFSTATSPQPYLSFDGGITSLVQYNTNSGGDYGDYNGVGGPRVQDAFATPGAHPVLGVELRALDVIGYDRTSLNPVPAPPSLALVGAGGLLCLIASGRFRLKKAATQ